MNQQSKDDILWILFCAFIGVLLGINLISNNLPERFATIVIAGFWVVVGSHAKWEEYEH